MVYAAHQTYSVPQQQQQHLPQQQAHHVQQLHTSVLHNPLLVNTNVNYQHQQYPQQQQQQLQQQYPQQQQQQLQQPVVPPVSYYGQPQTPLPVTASATAPAQSVASYYRQPQALTAATAAGQAHFDQSQVQQPCSGCSPFNNPQPYALVTLPNGQQVLDAGHGSGTPPADSSQVSATHQRVGDYAAQSPGATLDTYDYKQSVPGDTRSYLRHVTNCQPNGQCQQLTLNPGQIDGDHQQLIQAARSRTQAAASCNKSPAYVPPGAQVTEQGQLRPRGRRTNQHVQEQLAKYPYN